MYHTIWSIAAKMNCVSSLISAFENMRGKCKMAADLFEHVDENAICSLIPLSYNLELAFGGDQSTMVVTNMPGYLSSSMSLVSDLLYGATFQAVATCVAETLGACGTLLSSKTPKTGKVINGIMRDYGLQHTSAEDNLLLRNWEILAGRPITWEFGIHLKEYVLGLAGMINTGVDILMPQLLMTIPSLTAINTAFGLARGWKGPKHTLASSKDDRAMDSDGLASLAWIMGSRPVRPAVFYNRSGKKPNLMSHQEGNLQAELEGHTGVGEVGFWIQDTVGGRVDENEQTASVLYRTEYAGTKCSLVYSYQLEQWVTEVKQLPPSRMTLTGTQGPVDPTVMGVREEEMRVPIKPVEEKSPISALSGVNWGGVRANKQEDVLKHLKTLSRSTAIAPSRKPRHMRVDSSSGQPVVGEYVLGGEESTGLRKYSPVKVEEGDSIRYGTINVPGDGSCGIHALVEDLRTHGLIAASDVEKTSSLFSQTAASKSFHDAQELAALCLQWGMGMDLLDVGTGNLISYGERSEPGHVVTVVREGNHFMPGSIGKGDKEVKIERKEVSQAPDEEFVRMVAEYGNLFASPSN